MLDQTSNYSTKGIPLILQRTQHTFSQNTCATLLYTDLRGFNGLAEHLQPPELVPLLTEFFALVSSTVLRYGGQNFHMAGASLMAGFGIRDSCQTHTHDALSAALAILEGFAVLRATWQSALSIDTGVAIGIHRGDVAVGVFGPAGAPLTTLVGDAVNVAAQLCGRARAGEALLSAVVVPPQNLGTLAIAAAEAVPVQHLPPLELRGRSGPVDIWCIPAVHRLEMRAACDSVRVSHH
jgi:adenylate cyclase